MGDLRFEKRSVVISAGVVVLVFCTLDSNKTIMPIHLVVPSNIIY